MNSVLFLVLGLLAGIGLGLLILRRRAAPREGEILERLRESFALLSQEALSRSTEELLKLAGAKFESQVLEGEKTLEGKKQLIDQSLSAVSQRLEEARKLMEEMERNREKRFGELDAGLRRASEETRRLHRTTDELREALASTQTRGQWGERMAEDILRLAGFVEGVNYRKQESAAGGGRPDFTFPLPNGLKLNMDVKFPLNNYLQYLKAESEGERDRLRDQFLKDVRGRIKEVTGREYINPEEKTLDYVLVFIPNEQIYGFIHETDGSILDEAMKMRVVLCSPFTLYAILAVIRQAVGSFYLERKASKILSLLGAFRNQWEKFVGAMEKMGRRIDDSQREYQALASTRRTQLDRVLLKIEEMRSGGEPLPGERGEPAPSQVGPGEETEENSIQD